MKGFNFHALRRGIERVRDTPQLWLTIIVAVAIFLSFVFIAGRFTDIARDAQERLVNVRVGSLQDAFAPLAAIVIDDSPRLKSYMADIARQNPTIVEFLVVEKEEDWIVKVSLDDSQVNNSVAGYDFLLSLSTADPSNSFTIEEAVSGERFFRTARAIQREDGSVIAVLLTRQTLSEADRQITESIQSSYLLLVVILLLLLILFFHHARIIDYTELYKRLKEIDQLKDDFVSMVSHELRTPITIIRGYVAELIEKSGQGQNDETLKRIDQSAKTLNVLIADILDVARLEQGRLEFTITPTDPASIVSNVCEELTPQARTKNINISCIQQSGITIQIDGERLRQIIVNLVSNAIKYSDKGVITVKSGVESARYVLRVSDNGIGMSSEDQKKLFGKFYRVPGERVRKEVGTGLGLWITKKMVEGMRGTISVESIKGVGSHFIVSFPIV